MKQLMINEFMTLALKARYNTTWDDDTIDEFADKECPECRGVGLFEYPGDWSEVHGAWRQHPSEIELCECVMKECENVILIADWLEECVEW